MLVLGGEQCSRQKWYTVGDPYGFLIPGRNVGGSCGWGVLCTSTSCALIESVSGLGRVLLTVTHVCSYLLSELLQCDLYAVPLKTIQKFQLVQNISSFMGTL